MVAKIAEDDRATRESPARALELGGYLVVGVDEADGGPGDRDAGLRHGRELAGAVGRRDVVGFDRVNVFLLTADGSELEPVTTGDDGEHHRHHRAGLPEGEGVHQQDPG